MTSPAHAVRTLLDRSPFSQGGEDLAERFAPVPRAEANTSCDLGRLSSLTVRLAASDEEVSRTQALRYEVFYEGGAAVADAQTRVLRRDIDPFDAFCDHLVVVDEARITDAGRPEIVGTYRLLRQDVAERHGGFYSAGEFDILPLVARNPGLRFLELGRSCVAPAYRTKRTVELLWQGIWAYARAHGTDVMIGCASLDGTDPQRLAEPLAFLRDVAGAPPEWAAAAADPAAAVRLDALRPATIDAKAAIRALPPLLRAYLRVGAFIGEDAVVDQQFGTTDVLVVLPVSRIQSRYLRHYGDASGRYLS